MTEFNADKSAPRSQLERVASTTLSDEPPGPLLPAVAATTDAIYVADRPQENNLLGPDAHTQRPV